MIERSLPNLRVLSGCVLLCLSALGEPARLAAQSGAALAEIASYAGPDRTARLIVGAKDERAVNVYTSAAADDVAVLAAAFQTKYGIKLKAWRGSSENILQRAVVEARGGRFDVDAIETGATAMESLYRENLLQQVTSPAFADLAPAAIPPHREWIATRYNVFVAAYNTRLVDKRGLPHTYADLADRTWNGKLGIEAEDSDWFGALVEQLGEERGLNLFRGIVGANGISVRKGHTLLANLVISGEVPLAISTYAYKVAQLKRRGAPIDWIAIPPVMARFEGVGIARRAPHPYAAMLYLDFMLTDAQDILASRDFYPSSRKVKPVPADQIPSDLAVSFLDPAKALDQSRKWSQYYRDIITHPAR